MPIALTDDAIASLERATLDAVAPAERKEFGAWLIPFDRSTIGRATSAVTLRHHGVDASNLREVESLYAQCGLQAAFRIADVPGLANVTEELREMGYRATQPTLVQTGDVATLLAQTHRANANQFESVLVENSPSTTWSSAYTAIGFDPIDGAHRVQALSRSEHVIYASISDDSGTGTGETLAAGTASMSQNWAGIHGMRTVMAARGQGLARAILYALAGVANERNYQRVFLQVEETNTAALSLYRRAGFMTAWRYHYWRKPQTSGTT